MAYRNLQNAISVPDCFPVDFTVEYLFAKGTLFAETQNLLNKNYYYTDGQLGPPLT